MRIVKELFRHTTFYLRLVVLAVFIIVGFQAIDFGLLYQFEEETRSIALANRQYNTMQRLAEYQFLSDSGNIPAIILNRLDTALLYHEALELGNPKLNIQPMVDTKANDILKDAQPYLIELHHKALQEHAGEYFSEDFREILEGHSREYSLLMQEMIAQLEKHNHNNLKQAEKIQGFTILIMLALIVLAYFVLFRPYTQNIKKKLLISAKNEDRVLHDNQLLEQKLEEIKKKNEELALMDQALKYSLDEQELINKELNDKFVQVYRQINQLDTAQQMSQIGYWSYDLKESIIWSERMYRIFGIEAELGEMGPSIDEFKKTIHPEDLDLVFRKLGEVTSGDTVQYRHRVVRPSGEIRTLFSSIKPEFSYDQQQVIGVFGVVQDITEMVRREQEIEQVNQDQENILHIIAHDVRSPLNKLYTLLEVVTKHPTTKEERERYLELASDEYQGAIKLVEEMLESFSMKQQVEKEFTNIVELVSSQLDRSEQSFKNKEVQLIRNISADFSDWVYPNRIQRVLENLLSNALKFTPQGGEVYVGLWKEETDGWVLKVKDSGIGIPEELQANLFQKFNKKIRRKGLNGEKSTGLGMSIIKEIVEQHGGRICLKSAKWKGTAITIHIPFCKDKEEDTQTKDIQTQDIQTQVREEPTV